MKNFIILLFIFFVTIFIYKAVHKNPGMASAWTVQGESSGIVIAEAQTESIQDEEEEEVIEHISGSRTSVKKKKKKKKKKKIPEITKKREEKKWKDVLSLSNKKIAGEDQYIPPTLVDSKAKFIVLNFQDANIRDVILAVADLLKINYIIDPAVNGTITIHTFEKIPIEDAYPIFEQILAINGVSLIKKGKIYKFVPTKETLREPIETYIGRDKASMPSGERTIFQIIPIHYIPALKLQEILVPLLTKNGFFIVVPGPNRLFLVDSASNIKRLMDIIDALDVNMFEQIQLKLYEVKHADSTKLITEVTQIFTSMGYGGGKGKEQGLQFVDLPRLKSILIINAFPKLFPTIDYWMNKLDISLSNIEVNLMPVKYIESDELGSFIGELKKIFSALGYGAAKGGGKEKSGEGHILDFLNISRLNSILVINSYPDLFPKIQEWFDRLDIPPAGEDILKVYVYYVQHSDAENIAGVLNQLFGNEWRKEKKKIYKEKDSDKGKDTDTKEEKSKKKQEKSSGEASDVLTLSADVEGEVNIIADSITNSLIIRTSPRNYQIILDTIKKLDILPMQVLIEVLVAEVQLDEGTKYGMEWALREGDLGGSSSASGGVSAANLTSFAGPVGVKGLSFFVNKSDELLGMLQAFARESKLEILSSPILLASENKSASINIVNQIPIETTTVDPSSNITRSSIQYRDVGIKLDVLPKISKNKYISLEISQEVSQVVGELPSGSDSAPPIFTRQTQTSVVVKDKQTLVIAGLMETRDNRTNAGIPGIFKMPFLGCLFGSKSFSNQKTELLIFITPHIIEDTEEADKVKEEFKKKLDVLNTVLKNRFK